MTKLQEIQTALGVTADGVWGPASQAALDKIKSDQGVKYQWPFSGRIDGEDLVFENIVITCFGGWGGGNIADSQDNGNTASGVNTKNNVVEGVSVAMDGRQFSTLNAAEHRALDDAPIPRLLNDRGLTAWHTPVEVYIGGMTYVFKDGIVDLGPGRQASKPGEPHALDLTIPACAIVEPGKSMRYLTNNFERRGGFRVKGGARLGGLI